MKKLLPLVLLLLFIACEKEKASYPVKVFDQFEFEMLAKFGTYRVFTKAGEINNPILVNRYATEYAQYFYSTSSTFTGNQYKNFSFINDDSVINTGTVPVGELKRSVQGDYDVFKGKSFAPVNDTNSLNLHLGKYKMYKPVTTPLGYTYFNFDEHGIVMKKTGDKINLPIVRYIITSIGDNQFSFASDRINNELDPTGITRLGVRDTLVVQTFDVVLKRKQ